jgi:hypothetical protein
MDRRSLPHLAPVLDPVASLVGHAHAGNVDTVIVNGRVRKRGGKLVDIDLPGLLSQLDESRDYLLAGAEPHTRPPSSDLVAQRAESSRTRPGPRATCPSAPAQPEARSCVTVRSGLLRVPAQIGQRRTR